MYAFTILKKAYHIPETARDLTLGQFMAISKLDEKDSFGLLKVLTGEDVVSTAADIKEINQLERELSGVFKLIDLLQKDMELCLSSGILLVEPKKINILGLDIEVKPNFINQLPYGGYMHTKAAVIERVERAKNNEFNATDLIPSILAHNLYCLVTRASYNEVKAEEFEQVVYEIPFVEAMQLGNFFLLQHKKLWISRRKRWLMTLKIWRFRLAWKFSINTDRLTYWKHYRAGMY